VRRYQEQRKLLADPRISADIARPGYPSPSALTGSGSPISFILMDDPEHARLRRMVTAPFSVRRVRAMRPAVQKLVDDLLDEMLAGPKPVDLVEAFALPVPSLVICELLGVPYADHDFFQDNSKVIVRRTATPEQRAAAHRALLGYLDDLVGAKLADPADDLLSGLARRVQDGELTRQEAARMGVLLLIAGHETTANMIALGTLVLLQHPDQLALLRDTEDPELVASAVEELLRYLNITHNGRRRVAVADIEVDGQVIRAGDG
jgi:cytochrome P450